nr:transposase [Streptomyces hydrogenans]
MPDRCRRAGVPDEAVAHQEKWRLALGMLDTLVDWELEAPVVVADAGYGVSTPFRTGLEERGLSYVLALTGKEVAHAEQARPHRPRLRRARTADPAPLPHPAPSRQCPRGRSRPGTVHRGHLATGQQRPMTSRFTVLTVRPAGKQSLAAAPERGRRPQPMGRRPAHPNPPAPIWPQGQDTPTGYWISNLPATTPIIDLVRWAKMRWRIEHDYRELKHGLGLDHFEGRTWRGRHHHVTLVTAAQAFLTLRRLDPKAHTPA